MPAESAKQFRFMKHLESNPKDRLKVGMTEEQVSHFTQKPKKSIFDRASDYISNYANKKEKSRLQPPRNITGVRG